jgi:hypothetical protein
MLTWTDISHIDMVHDSAELLGENVIEDYRLLLRRESTGWR